MNEWKSQDAQRRRLKGNVMLDLQAVMTSELMEQNEKEDPRPGKVGEQGQAELWE